MTPHRQAKSRCSLSSLKSAFTFCAAPQPDSVDSPPPGAPDQPVSVSLVFDHLLEHSCDISSLRTISTVNADGHSDLNVRDISSYHSFDSSVLSAFNSHSSLMQLSIPSPEISFELSFSPPSRTGSPNAIRGSPFERPRAPTPGSVASRFSTNLDHSVDISDMAYEVVDNCVFVIQQTQPRQASTFTPHLDVQILSPQSSPRYLDRADVTPSTPRLLPPLNFYEISPLSL